MKKTPFKVLFKTNIFDSVLVKLVNLLHQADCMIYANQDFIDSCDEYADFGIKPFFDERENDFDFCVFDGEIVTEDFLLSHIKVDGFMILVDLAIHEPVFVANVAKVMIATSSKGWDTNLTFSAYGDGDQPMIPGLDVSKTPVKTIGAIVHQLRYGLRRLSLNLVEFTPKQLHIAGLLDTSIKYMNSKAFCDHMNSLLDTEEVSINNNTEPAMISEKHCWDCEHAHLNTCPLDYQPQFISGSGHCTHWQTNPRVEYGDSPEQKKVIQRFLAGDIKIGGGTSDGLPPYSKTQAAGSMPPFGG